MKLKIFTALITLAAVISNANAQTVVYEIPIGDCVGLELTSGDICSPPWASPEEAKQITQGNQFGCTWTSTGTGTALSVEVQLMFTINDQTTNIPTLLNASANNSQTAVAITCGNGTSGLLTWTVDPTNYNVAGSNTFLIDYAASSQVNQLDHLGTGTGGDYYFQVTVDYGACNPPTATLDEGTNVTCNGGNDGAIEISVSGGTMPYTYAWSHGPTTEDVFGLTAGTYEVIVTEDGGCTDTLEYTVTEPAPVDVSVTQNGSTITAGASGMTYQWIDCAGPTNLTGETGQSYTATADGDYAVIVTDGNGCTDTSACTNITNASMPSHHEIIGLEVYPNPSDGKFYLKTDANVTYGKVTILDMSMKTVHVQQINFLTGQAQALDLNKLEKGVYVLVLETSTNGRTNRQITIE